MSDEERMVALGVGLASIAVGLLAVSRPWWARWWEGEDE